MKGVGADFEVLTEIHLGQALGELHLTLQFPLFRLMHGMLHLHGMLHQKRFEKKDQAPSSNTGSLIGCYLLEHTLR